MSTTGYDDSFLPEHLRIKYAVSRTLGAGACGEVKLCFSKVGTAGKKYAMKIIPKSRINETSNKNRLNDEKQTLNEVEICKRLKHVSPMYIVYLLLLSLISLYYIIKNI